MSVYFIIIIIIISDPLNNTLFELQKFNINFKN